MEQEKLAQLIDFAQLGAAWLDANGQLTSHNASWLKHFGPLAPTVKVGAAQVTRCQSPKTGLSFELWSVASDDGREVILARQHQEQDAAKALITRQQQELAMLQEQLKGVRQSQGAFLASMSHELRTPLNAIIGYSELVLEETEELGEEHLCGDLKKILDSAHSLLGLINNILDLSLIESNRINLQWERVEIMEALAPELDHAKRLSALGENNLKVEIDDRLGELWLDRARFKQIVAQLLSNAAKFTTRGQIDLKLSRSSDELGQEWLKIAVHDTGIGIAQDRQSSIFEAFYQADNSTTRAYGGAGLGLALSKHFSRMMGGDITLTSSVAEGSTFVVRLPLHEVPESISSPEAHSEPGLREHAKLLIIDDDPQVHKSVAQLLKDEPITIESAFNGMDGLVKARRIKPDVITLDVLMPGLNGWTVLSTLKNDPELSTIPVIVLSMLNDRNMGFTLGASDFMTKPIDRARLKEALARYQRGDQPGMVLLVDDEPHLRDMMRRRIESLGWQVCEAPDGQVALEALERHNPDLVILDLMMPVMDGFEFLEQLRASESKHRDLPVLVLTAMILDDQAMTKLSGHVERVLQKNARSTDELLAIVQDTITKPR